MPAEITVTASEAAAAVEQADLVAEATEQAELVLLVI
jgi:hypothetical protein